MPESYDQQAGDLKSLSLNKIDNLPIGTTANISKNITQPTIPVNQSAGTNSTLREVAEEVKNLALLDAILDCSK